jgi:hypothetical protein
MILCYYAHFVHSVQRMQRNLSIIYEFLFFFQVIECLRSSTDPSLQLESVELAPEHQIPGLQLFRQLNIKASRKQVLPIVRCAAECIVKHCQM